MSDPDKNLLRIRSCKPEDINFLHNIDQVCFPGDIAFSRADFLFCLNHPSTIARVAEVAGRIIGFVLGRIEDEARAHVLTLDVVPCERRSKVGTILMNVLHDELKKHRIAVSVLEVSTVNLAAQRLYEKLDYKYLEILPGYYNGRLDAYRMVRSACDGGGFMS